MTNTSELWYYQYIVTIYNEDMHKDETRSGLIAAHGFIEAISKLDEFYNIEEIRNLRPITDIVFDFEDTNSDKNYDFFTMHKNSKGE